MDRIPDARLLRYFVVVAEELHFGRAARRLGIAQPPLSQQVRRLEALLGVALFDRTSRRVALTDAGRAYLATAERALAELARGGESARRIARGEVGQLAVGYVRMAMLTFLPAVIRRFRTRHPDVRLTLREMSTAPQIDALGAGTLDVAFVSESEPAEGIVCHAVWREPLVLVVPVSHRLARRRRALLTEVARDPFVFFPRAQTPRLHDAILALCREHGFVPEVAQEAQSWHTITSLVGAGLGVALAPASVSRFRVPYVRCVALTRSTAEVRVDVCHAASPPPAAAAFVAVTRAAL